MRRRIKVRNRTETKAVLNELFKYGYVFNEESRLKTWDDVSREYDYVINEWEYIIHGQDRECERVIYELPYYERPSVKSQFADVTLNQFLQIKGHISTCNVTK